LFNDEIFYSILLIQYGKIKAGLNVFLFGLQRFLFEYCN